MVTNKMVSIACSAYINAINPNEKNEDVSVVPERMRAALEAIEEKEIPMSKNHSDHRPQDPRNTPIEVGFEMSPQADILEVIRQIKSIAEADDHLLNLWVDTLESIHAKIMINTADALRWRKLLELDGFQIYHAIGEYNGIQKEFANARIDAMLSTNNEDSKGR